MRMRIEQVDLADTEKIRECFEVHHAAQRVDEPEGPWFTEQPFGGWLTVGWSGDPREVWLATDQGSAAGWYRLGLPARENLDQAGLDLVVHPAERRRGLGLALLRHAAGRAAAHGRAVLNGGARRRLPGRGVRPLGGGQTRPGGGPARARHRQAGERAGSPACGGQPSGRRPGYSLVSWAGPIPEEFLEQVAMLYNAMADAPRDPEIAHEEWDAQRVREARQRPAPALRAARLHGGGATRRHRRAGGTERDRGGSGQPGLGVPDEHRRDQEASRAPARAPSEDRDDGAAGDHGAAAGADLDLECRE